MKKRTIKKLLGITLVMTMLGSTLVGCGKQTEETSESSSQASSSTQESSIVASSTEEVVELEPVTLKWYHPEAEKEGTADVIEAFNKKLAEVLPNTTVEIVSVSDYATNWPVLMAGGETIDIAWVGYNTPYYQDVVDGNIMGISDLIYEYAPNLVKEIETYKNDWASCTIDGEIYGVPCVQPTVTGVQGIQYNEKLSPYMDVDALLKELDASEKMTEKMLDIFEAALQGAIDAGVFKLGDTSWKIGPQFPKFGAMGYQQFQEGSLLYIDPQAEDPEPMYLWEIPEFKMCVERLAEWYEKGWLSETEVLGQIPNNAEQLFWHQFEWKISWAGREENGIKTGGKMGVANVVEIATSTVEDGYKPPSAFGSASTYLAIPYTSKNPERAIMLLNILHDEEGTVGNELINMLCYGFEQNSEEAKEYGWFNYALVEKDGQPARDGTVRGKDENGKTLPSHHDWTNWRLGNTYRIMTDGTALYSKLQKEYCEKFWSELYDGMKETAISGMRFDFDVVSEEMENMTVVFNEYGQRIYYGCGGTDKVDAVIEEALSKLSEAGWDKVKKEMKAQIDAYQSTK